MERRERTRAEDQGWRKNIPVIATLGIFTANILIALGGMVYTLSYNSLKEGITEIKLAIEKSDKKTDDKFAYADVDRANMKAQIESVKIRYASMRGMCCSEIKPSMND